MLILSMWVLHHLFHSLYDAYAEEGGKLEVDKKDKSKPHVIVMVDQCFV